MIDSGSTTTAPGEAASRSGSVRRIEVVESACD